jgi:plastocyanin
MKNILFFVLTALLFSACNKQDHDELGENEIHLEYKVFHPLQLNISVGETVLFNNIGGGGNHTVTGTLFNSGKIKVFENYTHKFEEAGMYSFYCSYHASNQSEKISIIVE